MFFFLVVSPLTEYQNVSSAGEKNVCFLYNLILLLNKAANIGDKMNLRYLP